MNTHDAIDTGDIVTHGDSGEEWMVAYVQGAVISFCGWPDTLEKLADFTLVEKATTKRRSNVLERMAESTGHRADYARSRITSDLQSAGT